LATATAEIVPTAAQPDEQPTAIQGKSLFRDDFSNTNSGWPNQAGQAYYTGGGYGIVVDDIRSTISATHGQNLSEVVIDVTATKIGGPDENLFGVVCRYQDQNNFYFLAVSSDGKYGIGKFVNGQETLLGADDMQPNIIIHQGNTTNILTASCTGNTLQLTVNGTQLATVQDDTFSSGDVGLLVGTFGLQGAYILFDDFIVSAP